MCSSGLLRPQARTRTPLLYEFLQSPARNTLASCLVPSHSFLLPSLQVERQVDGLLTQLRPLAAGGGRLAGRLRALLEGVGDRPPRQQHERFSLWAVGGAGLAVGGAFDGVGWGWWDGWDGIGWLGRCVVACVWAVSSPWLACHALLRSCYY